MIEEKIKNELKDALKAQDSQTASTLRMAVSALHNRSIEKRSQGKEEVLTEEEVLDVLIKEAKKRKESAEIYNQGGRGELAQKELDEYEIIKKYLPEQLSEAELEKIVDDVLGKTDVKDIKEMGRLIGEIMKQVKGKADAKMVGEMLKRKLQ